ARRRVLVDVARAREEELLDDVAVRNRRLIPEALEREREAVRVRRDRSGHCGENDLERRHVGGANHRRGAERARETSEGQREAMRPHPGISSSLESATRSGTDGVILVSLSGL